MDEIRDYLRKPAPMRLYSEGMALFREYALLLPQFAPHFSTLSLGPLGNNIQTLEFCLKACADMEPVKAPTISIIETRPEKASLAVKTTDQVDMLVEIRKKRQQRSKAAQSFHDCTTDEQRAEVCDKIAHLEADIKELDGKLAYLQRYGTLPPKTPAIKPEPIPDTKEGLRRELQRTSVNINGCERQLDHLYSLKPHDKRKANIPRKQERMDYLVSRRVIIKAKIEELRREEKRQKDEQTDARRSTGA